MGVGKFCFVGEVGEGGGEGAKHCFHSDVAQVLLFVSVKLDSALEKGLATSGSSLIRRPVDSSFSGVECVVGDVVERETVGRGVEGFDGEGGAVSDDGVFWRRGDNVRWDAEEEGREFVVGVAGVGSSLGYEEA